MRPALVPLTELRNVEAVAAAERGLAYLRSHRWCGEVTRADVAFAGPGVLTIVLVEFAPTEPGVDSRVWVVGGDLPPAYLGWDPTDTWQDALRGYVEEMRLWTTAGGARRRGGGGGGVGGSGGGGGGGRPPRAGGGRCEAGGGAGWGGAPGRPPL